MGRGKGSCGWSACDIVLLVGVIAGVTATIAVGVGSFLRRTEFLEDERSLTEIQATITDVSTGTSQCGQCLQDIDWFSGEGSGSGSRSDERDHHGRPHKEGSGRKSGEEEDLDGAGPPRKQDGPREGAPGDHEDVDGTRGGGQTGGRPAEGGEHHEGPMEDGEGRHDGPPQKGEDRPDGPPEEGEGRLDGKPEEGEDRPDGKPELEGEGRPDGPPKQEGGRPEGKPGSDEHEGMPRPGPDGPLDGDAKDWFGTSGESDEDCPEVPALFVKVSYEDEDGTTQNALLHEYVEFETKHTFAECEEHYDSRHQPMGRRFRRQVPGGKPEDNQPDSMLTRITHAYNMLKSSGKTYAGFVDPNEPEHVYGNDRHHRENPWLRYKMVLPPAMFTFIVLIILVAKRLCCNRPKVATAVNRQDLYKVPIPDTPTAPETGNKVAEPNEKDPAVLGPEVVPEGKAPLGKTVMISGFSVTDLGEKEAEALSGRPATPRSQNSLPFPPVDAGDMMAPPDYNCLEKY